VSLDDPIVLSQAMLPTDANAAGNVHGGTLMKLADTAGAIAAARHAHCRVVTAIMDSMTFERPVSVGNLVTLRSRVTWAGRTSIETRVTIEAEHIVSGNRYRVSTAYLVFVALGDDGRPAAVPPFMPATPDEQREWTAAEERRRFRLSQRDRVVDV
jgi:uncharacterized protein (TIGR00369 family)